MRKRRKHEEDCHSLVVQEGVIPREKLGLQGVAAAGGHPGRNARKNLIGTRKRKRRRRRSISRAQGLSDNITKTQEAQETGPIKKRNSERRPPVGRSKKGRIALYCPKRIEGGGKKARKREARRGLRAVKGDRGSSARMVKIYPKGEGAGRGGTVGTEY